MKKRSSFPPVFWVANSVEILERIAYYGIFMGFAIYMTHLGYSKAELGAVQSIFLLFSYMIPVISGTFADYYFKLATYIKDIEKIIQIYSSE